MFDSRVEKGNCFQTGTQSRVAVHKKEWAGLAHPLDV